MLKLNRRLAVEMDFFFFSFSGRAKKEGKRVQCAGDKDSQKVVSPRKQKAQASYCIEVMDGCTWGRVVGSASEMRLRNGKSQVAVKVIEVQQT